jgi:hypothetical protein
VKAAFIPPIPHLHDFGEGDFHLILSNLLDDPIYMDHYKDQREKGAWLLLDNSAHEDGQGADPEKLIYQALHLNAQEVVVPDVLDNSEGTLERTIEALEVWNGMEDLKDKIDEVRFMYVPQGENYDKLVYCLDNLVKVHVYNARQTGRMLDFSIGISKDYETFPGGLMHFLDKEVWPMHSALKRNGVDVQVHMLGWGRNLWALREIAKRHKWLRSTDSAKPFVYATSKIKLDLNQDPPQYPGRPAGYFHYEMDSEQFYAAQVNSSIFTALAAGEL